MKHVLGLITGALVLLPALADARCFTNGSSSYCSDGGNSSYTVRRSGGVYVDGLNAETGSKWSRSTMGERRHTSTGNQLWLRFDHGHWNVTGNWNDGWGGHHTFDDGDWRRRRRHFHRDDGIYFGEPIYRQHGYGPGLYQNNGSLGYFGKHYGDGL